MKKQILRILALTVAMFTVFSLCACSQSTPFKRGTQEGNVYKSEFLSLTFEKPEDWAFYTDAEIAEVTGRAAEVLDDEGFEKEVEGSIIDFYAAGQSGDSVNLTFSKGTAFTDLDKSIEASIDEVKSQYASLGWTVEVGEEKDAKLGANTFKGYGIKVAADGLEMMQYMYFAKTGKYVECLACTSVSGMSQADFEAMFS